MSFITLLAGHVSYLKCGGEKCQVILQAIGKGPVVRFLCMESSSHPCTSESPEVTIEKQELAKWHHPGKSGDQSWENPKGLGK